MPLTTKMLMRCGISDRKAAMILSNKDPEVHADSTGNIMTTVIDRNRIRRWKAKVYKEPLPTIMNGLYFDGKIESTRQVNGTCKNEDHITIVSEPGSVFCTHLTVPGKSTSTNVSNTIISNISITDDFPDIKVEFV